MLLAAEGSLTHVQDPVGVSYAWFTMYFIYSLAGERMEMMQQPSTATSITMPPPPIFKSLHH